MNTDQIGDSEFLKNTAKICSEDCGGCDYCQKRQKVASYNINMIPGSGKLTEFPRDCRDNKYHGDNDNDDGYDNIWCPRVCPSKNICISECCEFQAASNLNFINGDLIICNPTISENPPKLCQNLNLTSDLDALDIFPNLLGINGNLYIVGTNYRRITGFNKLRFVAGSIVIVNNNDLIQIPNFPCLLNVSKKVVCTKNPDNPEECTNGNCKRGAIIIANNSSLRKISGFHHLRQVSDGIFISQNACLTHICGFMQLYRTDRVVIYGNPKLHKVIGFCHTDTLNVGLFILNNNRSGDFDLVINAFTCLEFALDVIVVGNNYLRRFNLDCLQNVRRFIIRSNKKLEEISSGYGDCSACNKTKDEECHEILTPGLKHAGDFIIENNPDLQLIKFPALREITRKLEINANCSLQCLDDFGSLKRVGKGISISDNSQLSVIKAFKCLKYIGSYCAYKTGSNQKCASCCGCIAKLDIDWTCCNTILDSNDIPFENRGIRKLDPTLCNNPSSEHEIKCCICDNFPEYHYDFAGDSCDYRLPDDFFRLVCEPADDCSACDDIENTESVDVVDTSLIIFRNPRLKCIGGFSNLKHTQGGIYIVYNISLHTINAFEQLRFALDIWIRNNLSLKYIIGFNKLMSVRDLTLLDSACLNNLSSLKSLDFAQRISLEAKTSKSIEFPRHPIPSVKGYLIYFFYGKQHDHHNDHHHGNSSD